MSLILNGTDGLSDVDGSASTPAIRGTDANTGIFFPAADTIAFAEGGAEVARFDSSGNLGIGTSSPAQKLDIASKVQIDTANSYGKIKIARATDSSIGALYIQGADNAGTGNELSLVNGGGGGAAINITGGDLRFYASSNTTERMRIDSSGNLLVGKTAASGTTQGIFLQADGVYGFTKNETGTGPLGYFVNANGTVSSGYRFASFRVTSSFTEVGTITTNGSSTTAYNTSSDYRLKENVAPMTGALNLVQQLKPVTYKWKADGSDGQGFIAHELQAVVPDCVTGEKDAVNEEGKPVYQGVDTSFLVATLTAAIQELKAELDATKAEVQALKGVA
jgi:hypothetical protein